MTDKVDNDGLVKSYISHNNMTILNGKSDDVSPILPFMMMDAQYQIYIKTIVPLRVTGAAKMVKNRWVKCYTTFNKSFFACYTQDQQDAIIDRMDDFEDFIANDLMFVKVAISDCFNHLDIEKQSVISDCLLCNILAQTAQITWGRVYKHMSRPAMNSLTSQTIAGERNHLVGALGQNIVLKESKNPYIEGVRNCSRRFLNLWYADGKNVDINDSKPLNKAVNNLCRKMVIWMKNQQV